MISTNLWGLDRTTPLFRIAKVEHVVSDIKGGVATLPRVIGWEDPHEAAFFTRHVHMQSGELIGLSSLATDWFGQCWSTKPESDAMWRIYNSHKDAVRIETTAEELLRAFYVSAVAKRPAFQNWAAISLFLGKVEYRDGPSMSQHMMTAVTDVMEPNAAGIARMLMQKRDAFSHESEVRFLYLSLGGNAYADDKLDDSLFLLPDTADYKIDGVSKRLQRLIQLPFDWHSIKTAMVGPLAEDAAALSIEGRLRAVAPWLQLLRSDLYGPPNYSGRF